MKKIVLAITILLTVVLSLFLASCLSSCFCDTCHGDGKIYCTNKYCDAFGDLHDRCEKCYGLGKIIYTNRDGGYDTRTCGRCHGDGLGDTIGICNECNGSHIVSCPDCK